MAATDDELAGAAIAARVEALLLRASEWMQHWFGASGAHFFNAEIPRQSASVSSVIKPAAICVVEISIRSDQ
jgi:hypothetical protein